MSRVFVLACEALPSSVKDDPLVVMCRVGYAMYARDFAAAEEILTRSPKQRDSLLRRP